jgi:hypothetical protein
MNDWEITVIPAYGKEYNTSDEAFDAWMSDKDFYIMTPGYPSYINKSDAERFGVPKNTIRIRFKNKTELLIVKFNEQGWIKYATTEDALTDTVEDSDNGEF